MRWPVICRSHSPSQIALIVLIAAIIVACGGTNVGSPTATSSPSPSDAFAVLATRQELTTGPQSTVAHDNEIMALAVHSGLLFAATDQWEYPGQTAAGQVLVKDSADSPWRVFEQTQSLRVQVIDSFPIPDGQGLGSGHSLLVTQAIVNGRSVIQWLLDGAESFSPTQSYALAAKSDDVRSFGAHESDGVWSVYAGVRPEGILRGDWSPETKTLVFDPTPELSVEPPRTAGAATQKVTAFAECDGALYVSINTRLFRRNDGSLQPGLPRWALVYQAPPVGAHNSGLRGLTCVSHDGSPSLLLASEGSGNVYRLDNLPQGQINDLASRTYDAGAAGLTPTLEFSPIPAYVQMRAAEGTAIPTSGAGSVVYVIDAYNNFETINVGGVDRQFFGIEFGYAGVCPATRLCGPTALSAVTFDSDACFVVRTDEGDSPAYALRCLDGPDFTPSPAGKPILPGQAFVSIRTIKPSPFGDDDIYYGGYDCNFYPADGAAWIGASTVGAVHPDGPEGEG
jgi:hypothetical protein